MLGSMSNSEAEWLKGGRYRAPVKGVRSVMYNPNASARNTCSAVHNPACASCIGSEVGELVPRPNKAASPGGRDSALGPPPSPLPLSLPSSCCSNPIIGSLSELMVF